MVLFFGVVEIVCGSLLLIGLVAWLAAVPLLIDIAVAKYSTEIVSFREELGFCRQRKHGAFVGFGTLPCHDFPPARASNKTCLHDDLKTATLGGELEDRFHHGLDDAVKCEAKPGAPVLNH